MFYYFKNIIARKYQDSTPEQIFENARIYQSFWGWGGKQLSKKIGSGPNMEDSPNLYFMFFDRYEIQIQVGVLFSNGKCSIFQSSSPQKIFFGKTRTHFSKQMVGIPFLIFEQFQIFRYSDIKK